MATYRGREIDLKPTDGMKSEAKRGLDWREEFGRGGTATGLARARQLSAGGELSPEDVIEMAAWKARHETYRSSPGWSPGEEEYPSNARISHALWGLPAGDGWIDQKRKQLDRIDEEDKGMTDMQVRAFAGGVTKAVGERQVRVVVSTPTVDRSGDIVEVAGIDLTAYRKNPVVLYQHDHDEPVARCIEIDLKGAALEALVQFPPEKTAEKSDEVYGLIKAGVINAASIGFIPKEYGYIDPKEPWRGRRFSSCEMLEFSFVSVPCNPDALIVERGLLAAEEQIALARKNLLRIKGEIPPETPTEPAKTGTEKGDDDAEMPFQTCPDCRNNGQCMKAGSCYHDGMEEGDYSEPEMMTADEDQMKRAAEIRDLEIKAFEIAIG